MWVPLAATFVPFDAFWLALAALFVALAGTLARLRSHHPLLFEELGRPTLLPRQGIAGSAALTRFYWSRRGLGTGDATLTRWLTAVRALQVLLAGVLAVLWTRWLSTGAL